MIKLHHLNFSRSSRIIWLMEELGADYELVEHARDPATFRSPVALGSVHPLAKAPTVDIDGHVMVESSAIIEAICEKFGDTELAPAPGSEHRNAYLEWLHFAEGTLGMATLLTALSPRFGGLGDALSAFVGGEVDKLYSYIENHLVEQDYLVASGFTAADINLEYLIEMAQAAGILQGRDKTLAYLQRIQDRPAYKKTIEIGGPIIPQMG